MNNVSSIRFFFKSSDAKLSLWVMVSKFLEALKLTRTDVIPKFLIIRKLLVFLIFMNCMDFVELSFFVINFTLLFLEKRMYLLTFVMQNEKTNLHIINSLPID